MRDGWAPDTYYTFFDNTESDQFGIAYGVRAVFPDLRLLGLRGWDDFLLVDGGGQLFTVPTVPLDPVHLMRFSNAAPSTLTFDDRFTGKVKWYIKPVVFGGDPKAKENMVWITVAQHVEAVTYWNRLYRDVKDHQVP